MNPWQSELEKLEQSFAFLQMLGFRGPAANIVGSKLVGDSLLLRYEHASQNRQIHITYNKGGERTDRSIVIVILAGNRNFLLRDYLDSIGRLESKSAFVEPLNAVGEADFIDAAAAAFQQIAKGALSKTLAGLEWPSVEFDWKGMR